METRGTIEFTKSVQKLHQQFQYYKDRSNRRLQDLEELIEVTAMNMEILKKEKLQTHRKTKVVNPFASREPTDKHSKEHLHHLKLQFPKFNDGVVLGSVVGTGSKVNEWPNLTEELLYAPQETYAMKPIYDEEPGKSHKFWLHQPYTQSEECAIPNEMVKRNQPRSSADSSISTRTGNSHKFGNVTHLQGTSQAYEAREVIKLSQKQQEDMLTGGICPYCHDKEGPSHEYIKQGRFVMAQKEEMSFLEKSCIDEKSEITSAILENQIVHSMPHLELSPPKFQGTGVLDSLQECGNYWQAAPLYDDASVYDDDPEKGQECWLEHEFISAALGGNNFYSSNLLQFEFCTSKRGEEKQGDVAEES